MNEASAEQVLACLRDGGSLRYFYLNGGTALHDKNDVPTRQYCRIEVLLELRSKGLIEQVGEKDHGYPHYADSLKSAVYGITVVGRTWSAPVSEDV